ncbi:MAG TPA: polyphenol oxidase family protein [Solirubrobacterales bacterium]|nr:polyphenol oxidase family protein [Solirubrobacterales bacterium]
MRRVEKNGTEWLEAGLPGAEVRFTTRLGGVSRGPFESLNLGVLTGDDRDAVVENRERLAEALGIDGRRMAMGRQVHASDLAVHGSGEVAPHYLNPGEPPVEVDGHVTSETGLPMIVLVADCLPVALSGPGGLAMIHCGWRGLAGTIVEDAAARIGATHAVVGPGIGPCCFEVGEEVFDAFAGLGDGMREGNNLDLPEVARRKLRRAGIREVETAGICTHCDRDRFFSHRRDRGVTGRQAGIAWLT